MGGRRLGRGLPAWWVVVEGAAVREGGATLGNRGAREGEERRVTNLNSVKYMELW